MTDICIYIGLSLSSSHMNNHNHDNKKIILIEWKSSLEKKLIDWKMEISEEEDDDERNRSIRTYYSCRKSF